MADKEIDVWQMNPWFKGTGGPATAGHYLISVQCFRPPDLPILREGYLTLEIEDGATSEEVYDLVESLNRLVRFMTYTGPVKDEPAYRMGRKAMRKMWGRIVEKAGTQVPADKL